MLESAWGWFTKSEIAVQNLNHHERPESQISDILKYKLYCILFIFYKITWRKADIKQKCLLHVNVTATQLLVTWVLSPYCCLPFEQPRHGFRCSTRKWKDQAHHQSHQDVIDGTCMHLPSCQALLEPILNEPSLLQALFAANFSPSHRSRHLVRNFVIFWQHWRAHGEATFGIFQRLLLDFVASSRTSARWPSPCSKAWEALNLSLKNASLSKRPIDKTPYRQNKRVCTVCEDGSACPSSRQTSGWSQISWDDRLAPRKTWVSGHKQGVSRT